LCNPTLIHPHNHPHLGTLSHTVWTALIPSLIIRPAHGHYQHDSHADHPSISACFISLTIYHAFYHARPTGLPEWAEPRILPQWCAGGDVPLSNKSPHRGRPTQKKHSPTGVAWVAPNIPPLVSRGSPHVTNLRRCHRLYSLASCVGGHFWPAIRFLQHGSTQDSACRLSFYLSC